MDVQVILSAPIEITLEDGTPIEVSIGEGAAVLAALSDIADELATKVDAGGAAAAAPVQSVAGKTGDVTVTKGDVGLGNADNTPDAGKPLSTPQAAALNTMALGLIGGADTNNDTLKKVGDRVTAVKTTADGTAATMAIVAPQLGPAWDPAEMAGDWYGAITSPDGLYQYLSFLMSTGAMRANGIYDTFSALTAGEDACPASQWIGTEGQGAILFDNALSVTIPGMGAAEVARLFALVGGLTSAILQNSGGLQAYDISLLGFDTTVTSAGEDAGAAATWIGTSTQGAIIFDASFGISFLNLTQAEAARLVALGGGTIGAGYTPPALLRDGHLLIDPVATTNYLVGKAASRDGFITPVKQRNAGTNAVALPDDPRPMPIFVSDGQSNPGWGGAIGGAISRKLTDPLYQYNVFGLAKAGAPYFATSGNVVDDGTEDDLLPLYDQGGAFVTQGYPTNQSIMSAFGAEAAYRARGETSPGILSHLVWWGGQPITAFIKGTQLYTNLINAHVRLATLAWTLYARKSSVPAVLFRQGETGPYDGTWTTLMTQFVSDMRTDIPAAINTATGFTVAAPIIMISQTNAGDNATTLSSPQLEQLAVCRALPTTTAMIGPSYFAPLGDSDIHPFAEGRAMIGEVDGEVYCRIAKGLGWAPLWSVIVAGLNNGNRVDRAGRVITIQYTRPGDELEFDPGGSLGTNGRWMPGAGDGWVKPVPNYGFYYSDSSGTVQISTVTVHAGQGGYLTQIVITLSADPDTVVVGGVTGTTNRFLSYGRHVFDSVEDFWSSARGSLRSRLRKSRLRDEGVNIPKFIYAYACCEEWRTGDAGVNL